MNFIRTKLATDWPQSQNTVVGKLINTISGKLSSNPDYKKRLHLVREWLIEFNHDNLPEREIGLNLAGEPVISGPDDKNFALETLLIPAV